MAKELTCKVQRINMEIFGSLKDNLMVTLSVPGDDEAVVLLGEQAGEFVQLINDYFDAISK